MKRKKALKKNYDVYIHCILHCSASYTNYNFKKMRIETRKQNK